MDPLVPSPLSSSGRPILYENEIEIRSFDQVQVLKGSKSSGSSDRKVLMDGILVLTNVRLIVIVSVKPKDTNSLSSSLGWELRLKRLESVADCSTFFHPSSKRVNLRLTSGEQGGSPDRSLDCKFTIDGKEDFIMLVNQTIQRKAWLHIFKPETPKEIKKESFSISDAGVSGILKRQTQTMQSTDSLAREALTDLSSLAKKAREVVDIIQRYAVYIQKIKSTNEAEDVSDTSSQIAEINEMETIMQSIGVVSPVTRLSAGRLYHQQLAQQVAEILLKQTRLQRLGGMITLTDLYCLYNRARGTELLSPEDLLSAANAMNKMRLGMSLRVFPSGVKVIQLDSLNEDELFDDIIDLLETDEHFAVHGITASHVAKQFSLSLVIAKERLLEGERKEVFCRDESIEGLHFFPNRFLQLH